MPDETIFQGSRLCVVGNLCRDVKTAPIRAEDRLFHDGETSTDSIVETVGGGGACKRAHIAQAEKIKAANG